MKKATLVLGTDDLKGLLFFLVISTLREMLTYFEIRQ